MFWSRVPWRFLDTWSCCIPKRSPNKSISMPRTWDFPCMRITICAREKGLKEQTKWFLGWNLPMGHTQGEVEMELYRQVPGYCKPYASPIASSISWERRWGLPGLIHPDKELLKGVVKELVKKLFKKRCAGRIHERKCYWKVLLKSLFKNLWKVCVLWS